MTDYTGRLITDSLTAGQTLARLVTVDGSGSGLDADLLDGQHGAFYLPAGTYTPADILAKLVTVDGAASGLDADLLDGQHGAFYNHKAHSGVAGQRWTSGGYGNTGYAGGGSSRTVRYNIVLGSATDYYVEASGYIYVFGGPGKVFSVAWGGLVSEGSPPSISQATSEILAGSMSNKGQYVHSNGVDVVVYFEANNYIPSFNVEQVVMAGGLTMGAASTVIITEIGVPL